ncbi:MAG: hypothetical protein V4654_02485 [Bdellovibrionota bacterium]
MVKKLLSLLLFIAATSFVPQFAFGGYCPSVGASGSTQNCATIYSSCGGGKLSAGDQCSTHHFNCVETAAASLAFPFSMVGEWQYSYSTHTYTPILENECPIE